MTWEARHADCFDLLGSLDAGSVSLVLMDPPYFRVKAEPWDRQWDDDAGFIDWMGDVLGACRRVLADNGSLMVFASPRLAARVEVKVGERFNVLNSITWTKDAGWHNKAEVTSLRSFLSPWERVVFAEPFDASDTWTQTADGIRGSVFEPLRAYLDGERQRAGMGVQELCVAMGVTTPSHYFARSQWALPTAEHYESMRRILNGHANGSGPVLRREYEDLRREYEDLRREYEDLRREYEDLRRAFNATPERPYTDVWTYRPVNDYPGKHPCEKPQAMLRDIIATCTRPGDLVVDPFMGTGSTVLAARDLGRQAVGGDAHLPYVEQAQRRLNQSVFVFAEGAT